MKPVAGGRRCVWPLRVPFEANTTYVASYYSPKGGYASSETYFNNTGVTNGALTALKSGTDGGNGVYIYGSGYPNKSFNGTNYWVDVVFQPSPSFNIVNAQLSSKTTGTSGIVDGATLTTTGVKGGAYQPGEGKLRVVAVPNPSASYFTLQLQGATGAPVSIRVVDVVGRVVETRAGVVANGTLTIGYTYSPGVVLCTSITRN